jgi:putative membrane protein
MHTGKGYSFKEVILWTRRDILGLLVLAVIPTVLYQVFDFKYLTLPWLPLALLGTAVAFVVGFKNNASYDRLWEARKIWGAITNLSRSWGITINDYITTNHAKKAVSEQEIKNEQQVLMNRHIAWLTALRFQLRENRPWEAINLAHNKEYKNKFFIVEEHDKSSIEAIKPYLSDIELEKVRQKTNIAAQIIALQSAHLKNLFNLGYIEDFRHMELEKVLLELYNQQGASERIKNYPYPRQFASINYWFIKLFIVLLPFGMIPEFAKLGGNFVWMTIPFSVLSSWIFTTMERIGETSENPFEGSANDVPITSICRNIEIDLLEILDIKHNLKALASQNNILT